MNAAQCGSLLNTAASSAAAGGSCKSNDSGSHRRVTFPFIGGGTDIYGYDEYELVSCAIWITWFSGGMYYHKLMQVKLGALLVNSAVYQRKSYLVRTRFCTLKKSLKHWENTCFTPNKGSGCKKYFHLAAMFDLLTLLFLHTHSHHMRSLA